MNTAAGNAREISLDALYRAIEVYRRYTDSKSLLFFEMFVLIASRNPVGPTEIANAIGSSQAVVTGALQSLGEKRSGLPERYRDPAALVSFVVHPADARKKLIGLTAKGSQLVVKMRAALGGR